MEPTCKPRFRQLSDYPIDAEAFKHHFLVFIAREFDVDSTMRVFFCQNPYRRPRAAARIWRRLFGRELPALRHAG